jgi:LPS-assembly protein
VDGYGTIKHGRLRAGDYPIFYTPYMVFSAKTKRQSGLLFPTLTYSRDKHGMDIELPFYWAISESTDATFYQRYMSERGFKEGVEFRYYPSQDTFGTLYFDFLNDTKQVKETVGSISRDWQESQKRWSFYLNHETNFSPTFSIRSDIRRVSDHWYFKDFSGNNYYLNNYAPSSTSPFSRISFVGDESLGSLESTVRLTKNWSLYNLTAVARYTDDLSSQPNDATLQKYPEVILTGFRQPLFRGSPLQYNFSATYDNFYRQEGQKGHLWEVAPTFYWPLKWGPYLQATPQVGFTGSLWERTDNLEGRDKNGDREVFQTGATLSSEVSRVFNVNAFGIDKIQHAIRPEVTYTTSRGLSELPSRLYVQHFSREQPHLCPDQHGYLPVNRPDGKKTYRELMRLKLYQTYDIIESRRDVASGAADNRPFSDVGLEFDSLPNPASVHGGPEHLQRQFRHLETDQLRSGRFGQPG